MLSRLVPVAIAVALTASCTTVSKPAAARQRRHQASRPTSRRRAVRTGGTALADPPERFAADGVPVGPQNALVGQSVAYSYAESDSYDAPVQVVAIDLGTGEERWRWTPDARPTVGLAGPASSTMGS